MRTMRRILFMFCCGLAFGACGEPIEKEVVTCDGSRVDGRKLLGNKTTERLNQASFGVGKVQAPGLGKMGGDGLHTTQKNKISYTISHLIPGEHFTITVWQHKRTSTGMIHVVSPSFEKPKYEWQLRRTTQTHDGDWTLMRLDITIPERMRDQTLHLELKPGGKDSLILWDDLKIERLSKRPVNTYHRKGILVDKRDGKIYPTVMIGRKYWMAQDLVFQQKEGKYTFKDAQAAVPQGWRIPTDEDWHAVERELGIYETSLNGTGGRGNNLSYRMLEGGDTGLDFVPTTEEGAHAYWTATAATDSTQWARFLPRFTGIGRAQALKTTRFKLRCVYDR